MVYWESSSWIIFGFFPYGTWYLPFCYPWGKSSFKSKNIGGRAPRFACWNIDFVWRWDNFSCQYFKSCYKCDITYGNMILSIFLLWDSLIHLYISTSKLELIPYLAHFFNRGNNYLLSVCFLIEQSEALGYWKETNW